MNILAVDDDELQLTMLTATLSHHGLPPPTTATSAAKAAEIINDSLVPFDLFLLDIQMPETDGIALCEQIRALPDYEDAPIIMLTALTDKTNIERAFRAGAIDYVTKPFDTLELMTRIKIAGQIARTKDDASHKKQALTDLQRQVYEAGGSTPEAPIAILGIPSVLDYFILSNFLLELPLAATFSASAFAVRIIDFEKFYYATNPGAAYELLALVASNLSEQMLGKGYFIAYAGSGIFVCVTRRDTGIDLEELSAEVHLQLSEVKFSERSGSRKPIRLFFGPHQTNALFATNRRTGLLHKAVSSVIAIAERNERIRERTRAECSAGDAKKLRHRLFGSTHA